MAKQVGASEPGRRVAFVGTGGPVRPRGEYFFEPAGDGTKVTLSLPAELSAAKAIFMAPMVQRTMDAEVAALPRAKAVLEAA
jgi:hypothetical protein